MAPPPIGTVPDSFYCMTRVASLRGRLDPTGPLPRLSVPAESSYAHLVRRWRSEAGWPGPWSEPTRCEAGTRPERFLAASSVPVILQADEQRRRSEGA